MVNKEAAMIAGGYPTTGQDWINKIADDGSSWSVMQAGLQLDQPLDLYRLRQAIRRLLEDEPVLSCRFDDSCEPPVWRPLELSDACWCTLVISRTPNETVRGLITEPLPDSGQSWQVQVIRSLETSMPSTDYLLVRAHHALLDAAGLRDLIILLAERYRQLGDSPSETLPKPGNRSMLPLFAAIGSPDPRRLFRPDLAALHADWGLPGHASPDADNRPDYIRRALDDQQSARWLQAAKTYGVTLTTLLLAGLSQTLEEFLEPDPEAVRIIQVTSNLRRYLPTEQAMIIGNLSGMLPMKLPAGQTAGPEQSACRQAASAPLTPEQLRQLGCQLSELKKQRADLHSAAMLQLLSCRPYAEVRNMLSAAWHKSCETQHAAPILSNLGRWPEETINFGGSKVNQVDFYGPAMHAPALLLAVIGYQGRIGLSIGHFPGERPAGTAEKLIDALVRNIDRQIEAI